MGKSARFHGYLSMQGRGLISLPPALRAKYGLDSSGAQIEIIEREDGVIEFRPVLPVPAIEKWFWEKRWIAGELEVDEHVRKGEVETFETAEELMKHLTDLADANE